MATEIRRAANRSRTQIDWLDSRHSFSFGGHYDPDNTHFGLLLVNNDDTVRPGAGFDTHPHRDMEIVTWVLEGALVHQDSEGHADVIYPGLAQRMSAGTGILHSEKNDAWRLTGAPEHHEPVHFVQMWVPPDEPDLAPGYQQLDIGDDLAAGALIPVVSGMSKHSGSAAIHINQRQAALHVARLRLGGEVRVPPAPYAHVFVAVGEVDVEGAGALRAGDVARITASEGQRITAAERGAEVLIWEMHGRMG